MIILPCELDKGEFGLVIFVVFQPRVLQSSIILLLYKYNEEECYHIYQRVSDLLFFSILQKMLLFFYKSLPCEEYFVLLNWQSLS